MSESSSRNLLALRTAYQPFEYPEAHDWFVRQQQSHWLWSEFSMGTSVTDWNHKLTEEERKIISGTLLGFTQIELYIGNYWANKVAQWFPKPEIQLMCMTFAGYEAIHAKSYNYLNETLNLEEYDAFLREPTASAKINNLINTKGDTLEDKAVSLAVYSAFGEGVSLYSNFAVLLYFSARALAEDLKRFNNEKEQSLDLLNKYGFKNNRLVLPEENLLKGLGEIIAYSVRDEHMHSTAGCWLFRQLLEENPQLKNAELYNKVYDAARTVGQLEFDFIDRVFNQHKMKGLDAEIVKAFIERRINQKLEEIGLKPIYEPNVEKAKDIERWFYLMTAGESSTDFFAARVSNYSKGNFNVDNINWDVVFA